MIPNPQRAKSESAAHHHRIAEIVSRLGQNSSRNAEICTAFDEAVEFSVFEKQSIAEAIDEFLTEAGSGAAGLRKIVAPQALFSPSRLPVMPKSASRLLNTTEDRTSAAELENIASSDPALAARLIARANSALLDTRWEICSLRDAVLRIGVPEARKVLLSLCLHGIFASAPLRELWRHSVAVADASADLANLSGVDQEKAYVAGLLHDIGRLGFSTSPLTMRVAELDWLAAGFPLVYAESMVYGQDHAALGGDLLKEWAVPTEIADAVRDHHRPEFTTSRLAATLYLAEDLSVLLADSPEEDLWSNLRKEVALRKTGVTRDQMDALLFRGGASNRACA